MSAETIGQRLRHVRGQFSQVEFADLLGIGRTSLIRYESGEREVGAELLITLNKVANVDPAWFLLGKGRPWTGPEQTVESIGIRLLAARKRRRITQSAAAEIADVSREMWGKYECGKAIPGGEVLAALAMAGWDVHYLLTGRRSRSGSRQLKAANVTEAA